MFQLGTYRVSHLAVRQGHVTLLDAGMVPQLQHAAARYAQDRLKFYYRRIVLCVKCQLMNLKTGLMVV